MSTPVIIEIGDAWWCGELSETAMHEEASYALPIAVVHDVAVGPQDCNRLLVPDDQRFGTPVYDAARRIGYKVHGIVGGRSEWTRAWSIASRPDVPNAPGVERPETVE